MYKYISLYIVLFAINIMGNNLIRASLSWLLVFCIGLVGLFSFTPSAQALEVENQQYFIKHIKKDKVLSVSPNFRGDLTQASLLPSLTEISEDYYIKATKSIKAEKLNGKLVPGLIVYVESKSPLTSDDMVATKP